jgi:hypothetical protein
MPDTCPICKSPLGDNEKSPPKTGDREYFNCPRCGEFLLSRSVLKAFTSQLLKDDEEQIAILSHAIRKMQRRDEIPCLDSYLIDRLLQNSLPSLSEQINNFILWLGKNTKPGKAEYVEPSKHQSILGAATPEGFSFVIRHLFEIGFIDGQMSAGMDGIVQASAALTFKGWDYFDKLNSGAIASRKVWSDPIRLDTRELVCYQLL